MLTFATNLSAPTPTEADHLTTKEYVDGMVAASDDATKLPLAGGIMTGDVTLDADSSHDLGGSLARWRQVWARQVTGLISPTLDGDATSKTYVDGLVNSTVQGLAHKNSVKTVSSGSLAGASYANGSAGVGATLYSSGDLVDQDGVPGVIGGYAVATGDSVLVVGTDNPARNGVYVCTDLESSTWVLTRRADNDTADQMAGAALFVEGGDAAEEGWRCTNDTDLITVGDTSINWVKFTGVSTIAAGTGLSSSGDTINVDASLGHVTEVGDLAAGSIEDGFGPINVPSANITGNDIVANGVLSVSGTVTLATPLADTNLAAIITANMVDLNSLDIDGGTPVTTLADSDLFIVDSGAGGTNRSVAASNIKAYLGAGDTTVEGTVTAETGFSGPAAESNVAVVADSDNIIILDNRFTFDSADSDFNCGWGAPGDSVVFSSLHCFLYQVFDIAMSDATTHDVTLNIASSEHRYIVMRATMEASADPYTINVQNGGQVLGTDGFSLANEDSVDSTVSPFVRTAASTGDCFLVCIDTSKIDSEKIIYAEMVIVSDSPSTRLVYQIVEGGVYPSPNTLSHADGSSNLTIGRGGTSRLVGLPLTQCITHENVQHIVGLGGSSASTAVAADPSASVIVVVAGSGHAAVKLLPRMTYSEVIVVQDATTAVASKNSYVFTVDSDGTTPRNMLGFNLSSMVSTSQFNARVTKFLYIPHRGRWSIVSTTVADNAEST